ncbi:RimJ/RimL family protein N-acetyltransferase [Rhodovulum iodosum]|uniref:RimJ/RimL family protein N-acetyltransferase n=1 Tax=Rhodovulum iodosum TaxID=68291 RepID=A0ABV3XQ56_9RHOB|nr:GNAT family N-acetyltransferase [Rhodovulum robiginosum]RSK31268.1 N-acetyltransferase [Rhodovulum robiginosum]
MTCPDIPRVDTPRLILRAPVAEDYQLFEATLTSHRARFMGGPLNPYEAWMLFAAEMGHWQINGFGLWTATARDSGEVLGMAGPWQPKGWPEPELAWLLWPRGEVLDIGVEAVAAARDWCYATLGWSTLVSYLAPKDIRAVKLAEALGARPDDTAATVDSRDIVYRHPSPDALRRVGAADPARAARGRLVHPGSGGRHD